MNKFTKATILSAALVAVVGTAIPSIASNRHGLDFDAADTNADGFLTLEEVTAMSDRRFDEIDANKDGSLAMDELKAHRQAQRSEFRQNLGERSKKAFARMDSNQDGAISPEELTAAMQKRDAFRHGHRKNHRGAAHQGFMDRVDGNVDGKITKAELTGHFTSRIFERLDTDKDNRISKAEAEAARKAFRDHWQQD